MANVTALARPLRTTASYENPIVLTSLHHGFCVRTVPKAVSKPIEARPLSLTKATSPALQGDERAWPKILASYRKPHRGRSLLELMVTLVPFVALWTLAAMAVDHCVWLGMALTVPAAGFLLRLFMIQHDCGHGSFFAHRKADDWTGRAIGVLTFTPYDYWRRAHAAHHASAGNLDERGVGDITTLTAAEYRSLSRSRRLAYRLYRNPAVMFGIGPIWLFLFKQRLPFGMMHSGKEPWVSTMTTNLMILVLTLGLIWLVGLESFMLVQLSVVVLAGSAGIWLFYVQHQFEETHWSQKPQWQFQDAALHGSSYYELPLVLRWLTANIGIHHVHHLSSRVPYYRLPEVLRDYPELRDIGRITIMESLRCVKLVLWDEKRQRLISFREAAAAPP
ncbi:fatty acid desaturase [Mesorhizobium sp.]|uniref:fatty acid desaturase n=1 Tax=Mesorhizobium sp. TaxID=1871066 RepID=UPI000FE38447|nr:fatty acid desaturase [Mesorhizobium sp.]RWH73441.1 MAG: fatty acid desaturase [Mesorhizobium sp.]RWL25660.1 MAG: fatty acid desaturase [Mesorhizobium sp.]RWL36507.1 MAG: fatty acid desaturase [Mesorhizobium sp.]RWL40733.1 MAG: fatty acid desaturase [Mesorhizobium sp.]RWL54442.1 MAG: fatty acid desaturase [Mesorhizobium sp.]